MGSLIAVIVIMDIVYYFCSQIEGQWKIKSKFNIEKMGCFLNQINNFRKNDKD